VLGHNRYVEFVLGLGGIHAARHEPATLVCLLVFEGSSNKSPLVGMDSTHEVVLEPHPRRIVKEPTRYVVLRKGGLPCEMASSNPVNQARHALPEYASLSLRPWDTSVTTAKAPFGLASEASLVSSSPSPKQGQWSGKLQVERTEGYFKKAKQTPNKHQLLSVIWSAKQNPLCL
jgi:hypothetical protein